MADSESKLCSDPDKIDLLKHLKDSELADLGYHRDKRQEIFNWSSGLLIGIIGALLVAKATDHIILQMSGFLGIAVIALLVIILVVASLFWQRRHHQQGDHCKDVIQRINSRLGYMTPDHFAPGDALLQMRKPGRPEIPYLLRFESIATELLGLLALIMLGLAASARS